LQKAAQKDVLHDFISLCSVPQSLHHQPKNASLKHPHQLIKSNPVAGLSPVNKPNHQ
jgi:hypothetical protein